MILLLIFSCVYWAHDSALERTLHLSWSQQVNHHLNHHLLPNHHLNFDDRYPFVKIYLNYHLPWWCWVTSINPACCAQFCRGELDIAGQRGMWVGGTISMYQRRMPTRSTLTQRFIDTKSCSSFSEHDTRMVVMLVSCMLEV